MKSFVLTALAANGKPAKSAKTTVSFTDSHQYFSVVIFDDYAQLTTPKGCYNLPKHQRLNQFNAMINGNMVCVANVSIPKLWFYKKSC